MSERLKFKGRLLEKEQDLRSLRLKISGLVNSIRNTLDPFAEVEDLDTELAAQQAIELESLQVDHKETQEEIKALKKALGQ